MRTFFNDEKRKTVVNVLKLGLTRRAAANCVGCHVMTIYNEISRNKKFRADVAEAEAGFEVRHTSRIEKASQDERYWRASAWSLERKYPEQYALRKPDAITPDQAERILGQFVEILGKHIPANVVRARVVNQLWQAIDASFFKPGKKGGRRGKKAR
jgi:hypothetical protein